MMKPLIPSDVNSLEVQPSQEFYKGHLTEDALSELGGDNFSYWEGDKVTAIVGMQLQWRGRAVVWALIGNIKSWVKFHRAVNSLMEKYIRINDIIRLEMTTEVGFVESERWARMLGFKEESLMPFYGPDGKDHKMMVRICQQQ